MFDEALIKAISGKRLHVNFRPGTTKVGDLVDLKIGEVLPNSLRGAIQNVTTGEFYEAR